MRELFAVEQISNIDIQKLVLYCEKHYGIVV